MNDVKKIFTPSLCTSIYPVKKEHENMRLDQFLGQYLETFSREFVKKKIAKGDVIITGTNGANRLPPHRPSSKLHEGETVTMVTHAKDEEIEKWRGNPIDLIYSPEILFEDENLIVISKPPFMTTHPAGRRLFYCATVIFEAIHNKTIPAVHRLDRETSGVLILAKSSEATKEIAWQFEHEGVKKCYFFIAKPEENFSKLFPFAANERLASTSDAVPSEMERILIETYPENSQLGKHAKTIFHALKQDQRYLLGLAFPKTGRQHQIRAHAACHGIPLLGDKLYLGGMSMFMRFKDGKASEDDYNQMQLPRHALHSYALQVNYQGKPQVFMAPIPQDIKTWIKEQMPELDISSLEKQIREIIKEQFNK